MLTTTTNILDLHAALLTGRLHIVGETPFGRAITVCLHPVHEASDISIGGYIQTGDNFETTLLARTLRLNTQLQIAWSDEANTFVRPDDIASGIPLAFSTYGRCAVFTTVEAAQAALDANNEADSDQATFGLCITAL